MHLRMSPACIDSDIDLVTVGISIMLPQEVEYSKLLDALELETMVPVSAHRDVHCFTATCRQRLFNSAQFTSVFPA